MRCKLRQWQEQNLLSDEKLKVQFKQEFHSWKHTRQLSISQGKGKDLVLSQSFRRPDSQLPGPTPAHADMEDQLYGLILDLRVQHLLCTLAICLQMAIEFDPTFLGGITNPDFLRLARSFFVRFRKRRQISVRRLTIQG